MVNSEKTNISADLARLLNNSRKTLNLHPKFSIIELQIALKDEFIQGENINKEVIVGLMAGMVASISNVSFGADLDNTMLLKAIQRASVEISKDPNNASLNQTQAITLGKAWVDKTTQKTILNTQFTSVDQLTSTLMHVKPMSFEKIINPKLKQQISKAFQKSPISDRDPNITTNDKGRSL